MSLGVVLRQDGAECCALQVTKCFIVIWYWNLLSIGEEIYNSHRLVALWWSIEKCCVSNIFLYWFLMAQWALVPFASATEALCILYKAFLSGFAFSSSVSTLLPLLTWAGFLLWIIFALYVDSDHWSALSRQWSDPWSLIHSLLHTCNFSWDCWELICTLLLSFPSAGSFGWTLRVRRWHSFSLEIMHQT